MIDSQVERAVERLLFFLGKDSANKKTQTLFTITFPTSFFPCLKYSSCTIWGLAHDFSLLQTLNYKSLLIFDKPIFAGEMTDNLFKSQSAVKFLSCLFCFI